INFLDQSTVAPPAIISQWHWDFGDGFTSTSQNPTHSFTNPGTYNVTLWVQTSGGCQSLQFFQTLQIGATPVADFSFTGACLPSGLTQFNDLSSVTIGTIAQWAWSFGDGGTSVAQSPSHNYATTGPFNVTLLVTTNLGCSG